jgi:hypothetical protein
MVIQIKDGLTWATKTFSVNQKIPRLKPTGHQSSFSDGDTGVNGGQIMGLAVDKGRERIWKSAKKRKLTA